MDTLTHYCVSDAMGIFAQVNKTSHILIFVKNNSQFRRLIIIYL